MSRAPCKSPQQLPALNTLARANRHQGARRAGGCERAATTAPSCSVALGCSAPVLECINCSRTSSRAACNIKTCGLVTQGDPDHAHPIPGYNGVSQPWALGIRDKDICAPSARAVSSAPSLPSPPPSSPSPPPCESACGTCAVMYGTNCCSSALEQNPWSIQGRTMRRRKAVSTVFKQKKGLCTSREVQ